MSGAGQVTGRHVVATVVAALIAAALHLPQPFLVVLSAFLLACENTLPHDRIPLRILAAWGGSLCGMLVMTLFPDQPWLLLPAFALMVAACMHFASLLRCDSVVLVAGMAAAAGIPAGILDPSQALTAGIFHAFNLTCGILSAAFAFALFPPRGELTKTASPIFPFRITICVGIITALSLVCAALFVPQSGVILVIASFIMGFRLYAPDAPPFLLQKTVGAGIGVVLGVLFNILVSGSGSNLGVFLILLALFFGALAWVGERNRKICPCLSQAGAMFAVAAPALPAPVTTLAAVGGRVEEILLGCAVAVCVFLPHFQAQKMERRNSLPASPASKA